MKILAIDSSGKTASCTLLEDNDIKVEIWLNNGYTHSQTLMNIVDKALELGEWDRKSLDYIAITKGPGSFTGIRIESALAQGLATGLGIKVVGVSTLDALAYNIVSKSYVCPILNARRNQVYTALYKDGNKVLKDTAIGIDELITMLPKDEEIYFLGDGVEEFKAILENSGLNVVFAKKNNMEQKSSSVALLAKEMLDNEESLDFNLEYLRKPQAQREREEKLKSESK